MEGTIVNKKKLYRLVTVSKRYEIGEDKVIALNKVNLEIEHKGFLFLFGPSGSGKSTLLHILGGLDTPTSGEVIFEGKDIAKFSQKQKAGFRKKNIGFVFQFFNLIPSLTALENVLVSRMFEKEVSDVYARQLLDEVGLGGRIKHLPHQLSGGERQRVAIARALVNNPEVLLADEPTGNLDRKATYEVMELFKKFNQKGKTIIVVTHDNSLLDYGNVVVNISDGRIVK
ncbi:MAG: ABC transporter ATP-binding protein [Candidatus Thermoplasmatota archaeon]|nr:ABC transporter ATP-binding protein [Candidatus Thermoplasmatota archaeon]MDP7265836.1 ABC transporter ATP-binding protein [Candidatus Thermoplasmatota archaeon]